MPAVDSSFSRKRVQHAKDLERFRLLNEVIQRKSVSPAAKLLGFEPEALQNMPLTQSCIQTTSPDAAKPDRCQSLHARRRFASDGTPADRANAASNDAFRLVYQPIDSSFHPAPEHWCPGDLVGAHAEIDGDCRRRQARNAARSAQGSGCNEGVLHRGCPQIAQKRSATNVCRTPSFLLVLLEIGLAKAVNQSEICPKCRNACTPSHSRRSRLPSARQTRYGSAFQTRYSNASQMQALITTRIQNG